MPRYRITTLVDITRTKASRSETDEKRVAQQANFNSLIQAIGMRANVEWSQDPLSKEGRLPLPFEGKGSYWTWEFDVERDQVFEQDEDPVYLLREDLNSVPVIANLDESVDLDPSAFITQGEKTNTFVEII